MPSQTKVCHCVTAICDKPPHWRRDAFLDRALLDRALLDRALLDRAFQLRFARLPPGYQILSIPRKNCGVQSTFFGSGGSTAFRLFAAYRQTHGLGHSNGAAGAFLGLIRTYGTYRTKVDRMANSFSADLLWCGFRPPVQRKKKILLITPHPRPICP